MRYIAVAVSELSQQEITKDKGIQTKIAVSDCCLQTDGNVFSKIGLVKEENSKLRQRVFSSSLVVGNDAATKFYTSLPSYGVFVLLLPYHMAFSTMNKQNHAFVH